MNRIRGKSGFTLVEVMIAMLIMGIVLVGSLQVCNSSGYLLKNLKHRLTALNIARAEIEYIKALGYDGIEVSDYTPHKAANVIIDEGLTSSGDDDIIGEMKTKIRNIPLSGYKVVVEISWEAFGVTNDDILETVLYSRK